MKPVNRPCRSSNCCSWSPWAPPSRTSPSSPWPPTPSAVPGAPGARRPPAYQRGRRAGGRPLPARTASFPATWGEFRGLHTFRGYVLAAVVVHPFRAIGGSADGGYDTIEVLDEYVVRAVTGHDGRRRRRWPASAWSPASAAASRPSSRGSWPTLGRWRGYGREDGAKVGDGGVFLPTPNPSLEGSAVEYLIVTNAAMAPAFQRLADHRTAQGLPALGGHARVDRRQRPARRRFPGDLAVLPAGRLREVGHAIRAHRRRHGRDPAARRAQHLLSLGWAHRHSLGHVLRLSRPQLERERRRVVRAGLPERDQPRRRRRFPARGARSAARPASNLAAANTFVDKVQQYEGAPANAGWTNRVLFAAEVLFPTSWPDDPLQLDGATYCEQIINNQIGPCTGMTPTRMYENYTRVSRRRAADPRGVDRFA